MIQYPHRLHRLLRAVRRRSYRDRKNCFETTADIRSLASYYHDPDSVLSGQRLTSAETDPEADRSLAIANLALDAPERFLELVGELPAPIQDIFLQYYLLGRTQTQIGYLLGRSQTAVWQQRDIGLEAMCAFIFFEGPPTVSQMVEAGMAERTASYADEYRKTRSFACVAGWHFAEVKEVRRSLLEAQGRMAKGNRTQKLIAAWLSVLLFRAAPIEGMIAREKAKTKRLNVRAPKGLGTFVVRADDPGIGEVFAPGTTDGPISRGA